MADYFPSDFSEIMQIFPHVYYCSGIVTPPLSSTQAWSVSSKSRNPWFTRSTHSHSTKVMSFPKCYISVLLSFPLFWGFQRWGVKSHTVWKSSTQGVICHTLFVTLRSTFICHTKIINSRSHFSYIILHLADQLSFVIPLDLCRVKIGVHYSIK